MSESASDQSARADIDFLRELRREQVGFRLYGVLFALLFIVIAVFMAISTFLTVQRLDAVDSTLSEVNAESREARIGNVRLYVELGELKNAQEDRNNRDVVRAQELDANRRLTAALDPADVAALAPSYGVRLAAAHITGTPVRYTPGDPRSDLYNGLLNLATVAVIRRFLSATGPDGADLLSGGARLAMEAALADWQGLDIATRQSLFERLAQDADRDLAGVGYAGLARLAFARAGDDEDAPLAWESGCEDAVRYATEASARLRDNALGVNAATALIVKGACLRKSGFTADAHLAFREALDIAAPGGQSAYPESSEVLYEAYHGVGTTMIALANLAPSEREDIAWPDNAVDEARALIKRAADYRTAWGMGDVGRANSLENEGFIYLQERDFEGLLRHTAFIDDIAPFAWNLTCRLAAATELAKANPDRAPYFQDIADETLLKLSLTPRGSFDEPELRRLTPPAFSAYVDLALDVSEREPEEVFDNLIAIATFNPTQG